MSDRRLTANAKWSGTFVRDSACYLLSELLFVIASYHLYVFRKTIV